MYDRYYNFSAEPFRLSPDHAFAFEHSGYSKARAYMAYAYLRAEGFVMVTGRPGTGKTTLIGALIETLADQNVNTANLVSTQVEADDLLTLVGYEFGVDSSVREKGELLQALSRKFKAWHREGRRTLLIVDEAQDLPMSALEELRLLTNIQLGGQPLLQIFLLGQPELRELILRPELEQVHQRIVAASNLEPLERDETAAYIRHRLEAVGWQGDPAISDAVYPLVHKFSQGIPRRINLICSRLFLHCAVEQRHKVCVNDMRTVIAELQQENLAAGLRFNEQDFRVADRFRENAVPQEPEAAREVAAAAEDGVGRVHTSPDWGADVGRGPESPGGVDDDAQGGRTETRGRVVPLAGAMRMSRSDVARDRSSSGNGSKEAARAVSAAPGRAPEAQRARSAPQAGPGTPLPQGDALLSERCRDEEGTGRGNDRNLWMLLSLTLLSVLLVAWAATGFSLGPLTR